MEKFLTLLKNPKFLMGSLAVSLLALIVLICVMLGFGVVEILLIIVSLVIIWNVYLLIRRIQANKKAEQLEGSLSQQADDQIYSTRPDRRDDITNLKTKLNNAIEALKNSKLGKSKYGNAALYTLPWYMIIGPPVSGKSTVLRHSELEFPYVDPDSKDPKVKGLGGTKNCDFWFTTDGILLDTAGRYVMPTAQAEDREEWSEFLKFLKKHRRKMPINGVIVAVSVAEKEDDLFGVLTSSVEEIDRHAKNIRGRIDELIKTLEIEFPIYLLFTKCDLLNGFVEFYDDLGKSDRSQVWGYTLPKSQWQSRNPRDIFKHELKNLYQYLNNRRLQKLADERKPERKRNIYNFPLEFLSTRKKLARFVEKLFEYNRYLENPVFRGFYFTSGTQEGTPIAPVLNALIKKYGITTKEFTERPKETKSYFIQDLFTKIIFPDQGLVSPSSKGERRKTLIRLGISAAVVVLFASILLAMGMSYRKNQSSLRGLLAVSRQVSKLSSPGSKNDLRTLEFFRTQIQELERGPSLGKRWGMYRGDAVVQEAKDLYFKKWHRLFLRPAVAKLEQELRSQPQSPVERTRYYTALQDYLMMSGECQADTSLVASHLLDFWIREANGLQTDGLRDTIRNQVFFYTRELTDQGTSRPSILLRKDEILIQQARANLRQAPGIEIMFNRLKTEGKDFSYSPVPLEQNALLPHDPVEGLFTKKGWDDVMARAGSNLSASSQTGDCVLGGNPGHVGANSQQVSQDLYRLYFNEYVAEWKNVVERVYVGNFDNLKSAAKSLKILSREKSPLILFFQEVVDNTTLSGNPLAANLKANFKSFHEIMAVPAGSNGGSSPIMDYLAELVKLQGAMEALADADAPGEKAKSYAEAVLNDGSDELNAAWNVMDQLVSRLDPGTSAPVRDLLEQPLKKSWGVIAKAAEGHINSLWQKQVFSFYNKNLAGKYPFAASANVDALLTNVVKFFKPGDGILPAFYDTHIQPLLKQDGNLKPWKGKAVPLSIGELRNAKMITETLFSTGSPQPQVSFDLEPLLPMTSEQHCMLLSFYGDELNACQGAVRNWPLKWPATGGEQRVVFIVYRRTNPQIKTPPVILDGEWAFFKFLNYGTTRSWEYNKLRVSWVLQGKTINARVGLLIKPTTPNNIFRENFFSSFSCPSRL